MGDDFIVGNFGAGTLRGGNGNDALNGGIFDPETEVPTADSSPDACDGGNGARDMWFDCQSPSNLEIEFTS